MSERFTQNENTGYAHRPEYEVNRSAALDEPTLEALEELLNHRDGITTRESKEGVAKSRLSLFCSNDEATLTEVDVTVEDYRSGPLQRMGRFALREFIMGSSEPFITRYHLEQYLGGGTHALVEKTDIIASKGFDSHPMTFYDYTDLLRRVEATAEMIQLIAEADNG